MNSNTKKISEYKWGSFTEEEKEEIVNSYASLVDFLARRIAIRLPPNIEVQDLVMVRCPVCGRQIDERVFFPEVGPDMVDFNQIWQVVPNWRPDSGACASCLATFGPLS